MIKAMTALKPLPTLDLQLQQKSILIRLFFVAVEGRVL